MLQNNVKLTDKGFAVGRRAENIVTEVTFDITELIATYGAGTAVLMFKRPYDENAYPVTVEQSGNTVTWIPTNTDLYYDGTGAAELFWYLPDDALAKSIVWRVFVARDIGAASGNPPEPYDDWVETLTALGAETLENAQAAQAAQGAAEFAQGKAEAAQEAAETAQGKAEDAQEAAEAALHEFTTPTASADTLQPGSAATAAYSAGHFTFGIPQGEKGDPGDQGQTGATPDISIGSVTTGEPGTDAAASITGTAENPVLNLTIPRGDPGEVTEEQLFDILPVETASGAIASFSDGAKNVPLKSLNVGIEPVQDLHGYASPWPGGGGINIADISDVSIPTGQDNYAMLVSNMTLPAGDYTLSWTLSANVTATRNRPYHCKAGTSQEIVYMDGDDKTAGRGSWTFTLAEEKTLDIRWWYHTVSPACTLSNIMLERGSTAHDYAPYSNVCPISGWTGANVYSAPGNILENKSFVSPSNGVTCVTEGNNKVTLSGQASAEIGFSCFKCDVINGVTYTISVRGIDARTKINVRTFVRSTYKEQIKSFTSDGTYTFTCDGTYDGIDIRPTALNGANLTTPSVMFVSVGMGSNAVPYEPNTVVTYPITWQTEAGTVYGGTLDVTSGVLTVDKAIQDLGALTWGYSSWTARMYTSGLSSVIKKPSANNVKADIICSIYLADTADHTTSHAKDKSISVDANGTVAVYDSTYSDPAAFETYMSGVQMCYALATPLSYQLSETEVKTLYGQNNIFADCGPVSVEYRADIQKYINKVVAALA